MIIIKGLEAFGDYCTLMWRSISVPEKWKEFFRRYLNEISKLGIDSIPLILIVSLFIGCLCTILIKLNMESPLLPRYRGLLYPRNHSSGVLILHSLFDSVG